ncbi:hypothetical protein V8E36_006529 [Tilletia maclaganii]
MRACLMIAPSTAKTGLLSFTAFVLLATTGSATALTLPPLPLPVLALPTNPCALFQKAGLTNLDQLGCTPLDASALAFVLSSVSKTTVCDALHQGGLTGLDAFGCGSTTTTPTCKASDTCSVFGESLINLDLLGCSDIDIDILKKRGAAHHTQTCSTKKSTTTKKTTTTKKSTTTKKPTSTTTKKTTTTTKKTTTTTKKTTTTPKPTPTNTCSNKDTCKILGTGGLVNLSVLGCSDIDVDVL